MELKELFPTKIAMALMRSGIRTTEQLVREFDQIDTDGANIRGLGKSGYQLVEYIVKVELA